VVRVLGYTFRGPGSIPGTTRKKSSWSGTWSTQPCEYNWRATWYKSSGSCLYNWEYGRRDPSRWPRGTLYPQKLAITSPTSGSRSVGIVRSRTQTMKFFLIIIYYLGACGSVVGWSIILQGEKSTVRFSMKSLYFSNCTNPSARTVALELTEPLTEISTKKSFWARKADATFKPTV
jgi:hypothetical protein